MAPDDREVCGTLIGMPRPAPVLPTGVVAALRDLAREGEIPITVAGDCMAPRLPAAVVAGVAAARFYWPGDVLAFHGADGRLVLHRLLGYRLHRGRFAFVTRGDSSPIHDFPVPPSRVLGRARVPGRVPDRLRALARGLSIVFRRHRS